MSKPPLPPVSLAELDKRVATKREKVVVTFYTLNNQSHHTSICSTKEEYLATQFLLCFDENVDPSSVITYGLVPEDWRS